MSTPYAWFISNSAGTQASYSWWSLSPLDWKLSFSGAQRWISDWFNWGFESVKSAQGVRPVISLKTCIKYGIGDGSATNPYTILETESGC